VADKAARSHYLDSLRMLAIVGVVAAHTAQTVGSSQRAMGSGIDGWMLSFFNQGAYGVPVFFFLSGYLLAMIYGFSNLDQRESRPVSAFWIKRFFRIYPLWILFFGIILLRPYFLPEAPGSWSGAQRLVQETPDLSLILLVALTLSFTMWLVGAAWDGFIPGGWSIQAEMLHYAFFAIVRKWRLEGILLLWLTLAIPTIVVDKYLARVDIDAGVIEGIRSQNLASTVVFFLAGCTAFLLADPARRRALSGSGRILVGISTFALLLLPLNNVKNGQAFAAYGFVAFAVLLAFLISRIDRLRKPIHWVAKFSYFSYFFHFFVLEFAEWAYLAAGGETLPGGQIGVGLTVVFSIALVTAVCTCVGALSWIVLERPMISISERIVRRRSKRAHPE
jgi:peptidoglycan/LPS O-acetylase OafA/YrhL